MKTYPIKKEELLVINTLPGLNLPEGITVDMNILHDMLYCCQKMVHSAKPSYKMAISLSYLQHVSLQFSDYESPLYNHNYTVFSSEYEGSDYGSSQVERGCRLLVECIKFYQEYTLYMQQYTAEHESKKKKPLKVKKNSPHGSQHNNSRKINPKPLVEHV